MLHLEIRIVYRHYNRIFALLCLKWSPCNNNAPVSLSNAVEERKSLGLVINSISYMLSVWNIQSLSSLC